MKPLKLLRIDYGAADNHLSGYRNLLCETFEIIGIERNLKTPQRREVTFILVLTRRLSVYD